VAGQLTREHEYLGDLARAWAEGVVGTVPPPRGLDRGVLARLLARQPALPTIAAHLDPHALPDAERDQLRTAAEIARRRSAVMLLELERILPVLEAAGCRPVVLKGAALALTVYPRPEDRWFLDLDLWVPGSELATAREALDRLGYQVANPRLAARYYRKHHFHEILISNQGVCVEVHWALTLPGSVYSHDLDALAAGARARPLGRTQLRPAPVIDQILHGVLQSIAGGFGDLRRIIDLHLLDATLDPSGRRSLIQRAEAANLTTALWLHYHLRQEILGVPIPTAVVDGCQPSLRLTRVLSRLDPVAACLGLRPQPAEVHTRLLHWLCTPRALRPREFARYLWPSEADLLMAGQDPDRTVAPGLWARLWVERLATTLRMFSRLTRASV
jgi:hypothetical protein